MELLCLKDNDRESQKCLITPCNISEKNQYLRDLTTKKKGRIVLQEYGTENIKLPCKKRKIQKIKSHEYYISEPIITPSHKKYKITK